jgi:iron(III) transport system substrate-binding protein
MKRYLILGLLLVLTTVSFACGGSNADNRVVIYSSLEDFRSEHLIARLNEQFPDYDIILDYTPSGNISARLKAEGTDIECDIALGFDISAADALGDVLADLSDWDFSIYLDELIPAAKNYMVWERWSGCIVIDENALNERGLPIPASYTDLLDPMYRGLISMPNPASSGTGYFFLWHLVNVLGEEEAFAYFDQLAPNILQFTSSGSGPINAIIMGEAAIGFGMTFQAVTEKNKGANFTVTFFEEGSPYGASGLAMVRGREDKPAVRAVFDFLLSDLIIEDKELFSPELIMKGQTILVPNYPHVPYADMTGYFNEAEKTRLLDRWMH